MKHGVSPITIAAITASLLLVWNFQASWMVVPLTILSLFSISLITSRRDAALRTLKPTSAQTYMEMVLIRESGKLALALACIPLAGALALLFFAIDTQLLSLAYLTAIFPVMLAGIYLVIYHMYAKIPLPYGTLEYAKHAVHLVDKKVNHVSSFANGPLLLAFIVFVSTLVLRRNPTQTAPVRDDYLILGLLMCGSVLAVFLLLAAIHYLPLRRQKHQV